MSVTGSSCSIARHCWPGMRRKTETELKRTQLGLAIVLLQVLVHCCFWRAKEGWGFWWANCLRGGSSATGRDGEGWIEVWKRCLVDVWVETK